jgi:arylformamidase
LESSFPWNAISSLVVRTKPNDRSKLTRVYSNTNFAYFTPEALAFLAEKNIRHLLTDLPSVDREEDGGKLAAHHAFWMPKGLLRQECTITEFVFVDDNVYDGEYVLQLQTIAIHNDASPSRPLLFEIL